MVMSTLAEQVQIEIRQQRIEAVGRDHRVSLTVTFLEPVESIVPWQGRCLRGIQVDLKDVGLWQPQHPTEAIQFNFLGARHKGPHQCFVAIGVSAEYAEWIVRLAVLEHRQGIGQFSGHAASHCRRSSS